MAVRVPTLTKTQVDYRHGTAEQHCGNCMMFHQDPESAGSGRCDLVIGPVSAHMVCNRWEAE